MEYVKYNCMEYVNPIGRFDFRGSLMSESFEELDAVVIGAGITGLHLIYRLRAMGLRFKVFDEASDVGGTWFWNRYPGARLDSESYSYGYSFSEDLLQEWNWSELFVGQPEIERYIHYVADKFDLRPHIQFKTRVAACHWHDRESRWTVETDAGDRIRAKYVISAVGILSVPYTPDIPGLSEFKGEMAHTGRWPLEGIELDGKHVAIIGTAASGVQVISAIADKVASLTIYQRTPMFVLPLNNSPIGSAEMADIKTRYPEIFKRCNETFNGFIHGFNEVSVFDHTKEQRLATFEELYSKPGFAKTFGSYYDLRVYPEILEEYGDFLRAKIRERVPEDLVELVTPTDHLLTTRRAPMVNDYYDVFKRPNVHLIDIRRRPIDRVEATGVVQDGALRTADVIILATGFDSFVGGLKRIDIRGRDGLALKDKWANGPQTYLGIQAAGFPNLFTCLGPHNKGAFCNAPRCIEQNVEWVADCIAYLERRGIDTIEPDVAAEREWTAHVNERVENTVLATSSSHYFGENIPGKARAFLGYFGPFPEYRERCAKVAENNYSGFLLSTADRPVTEGVSAAAMTETQDT